MAVNGTGVRDIADVDGPQKRGSKKEFGGRSFRDPDSFFAGQCGFSLETCIALPSIPSGVKLLTGEPDAGDPPVRFGGRGDHESDLPYPYHPKSHDFRYKYTENTMI